MEKEASKIGRIPCGHKYDGHDLKPFGGSYYKRDGDKTTGLGLPKMDQSVSYIMLYCTKCGATQEVTARNHLKVQEG